MKKNGLLTSNLYFALKVRIIIFNLISAFSPENFSKR